MPEQQDRQSEAAEGETTTPSQARQDVTGRNVQTVLVSSLLLGIIAGIGLAVLVHWR